MDIKTRLEDDKVLFADFQSNVARTNILMVLNQKGIFTVEDLINIDMKNLPASNRKTYNAMAHVFRNAYLGQDLVYDELFQIEFKSEPDGLIYIHGLPAPDIHGLPAPGDIKECSQALLNLGLVKGNLNSVMWHLRSLVPHDTTFTIEELLRENKVNSTGPNLRRYYLQYIDNKKMKEQETTNVSESTIDSGILSELKNQLSSLITMKEGLEQQIISLQQQIETLEGGKTNGRK